MADRIFLVVPSYNDSARLGFFLPILCEAVFVSKQNIRIQIVDDGSVEKEVIKTREIVDACRNEFKEVMPLLCLSRNIGKGGAIYAGWEMAGKDEWLAFVDADGAVPAEEVLRIFEFVQSHKTFDGLLASRVRMLGHDIHRTMKRHIVGRVYAMLTKLLLGVPVYDSQCGFKIYRRKCFEQVRADLQTTRFGFDIELLANFYLRGFRLLEMPIRRWQDVPGAKVHLLKDSINMLVSLFKLRKSIWRKKLWMF